MALNWLFGDFRAAIPRLETVSAVAVCLVSHLPLSVSRMFQLNFTILFSLILFLGLTRGYDSLPGKSPSIFRQICSATTRQSNLRRVPRVAPF